MIRITNIIFGKDLVSIDYNELQIGVVASQMFN